MFDGNGDRGRAGSEMVRSIQALVLDGVAKHADAIRFAEAAEIAAQKQKHQQPAGHEEL